MQVFEDRNNIGQLRFFEVNNTFLGRRGVVRIIKRVPGVTITQTPKIFLSWFRESEFCKFKIGENEFTVGEPFGDNSRYWISGPRQSEKLEDVASEFKQQRLPFGL
ncbi:MAG: hypothetical protein V7721_03615 [Porticoccaceae bacterium]